MSRLAVGFWGGMTMSDVVESARLADRLGYEGMFTIESYGDPFTLLGACAMVTNRITLGTAVATVFSRNPLLIARAAVTVNELSGGRLLLGLGVGHRELHEMRDNPDTENPIAFQSPQTRLKEATELIREFLRAAKRGEQVHYDGQVFSVAGFEPWPTTSFETIPIIYGAVSPATLRLAGELGVDGIMPILLPAKAVSEFRREVELGRGIGASTERRFEFACLLPVCVSQDRERAFGAVRNLLASHLRSFGFYRAHLKRLGFYEELSAFMAAAKDESISAAEAIPREMVDALMIYGDVDECRAKIDLYRDAGVTLPVIYPIHRDFVGYQSHPTSFKEIGATIEALAPI